MKKIFALALLLSITLADCAYAQPPRRRAEQQQKQEQQLNAPRVVRIEIFPPHKPCLMMLHGDATYTALSI